MTSIIAVSPIFLRSLLGIAAWGTGVGLGIHSLIRYETTPGQAAVAVNGWPTGFSLARDPAKPTLVMLVHPNCPCSRASISELNLLMSHCPNAATAYVIFERPFGLIDDPATTDLWRSASSISGVHAINDEGAGMACAFHANTSGQLFVYDAGGSLRFSGGITDSRGHAGDNEGRSAVEELLRSGTTHRCSTPVFGCPLQ